MKKVLNAVAIVLNLGGMTAAMVNLYLGNLWIGLGLGICHGTFLYCLCWEREKKVLKKKFTLIELVAVISIISVLLTITFRAMSIDPSKADITRIKSDLILLQTQAMVEREVKEFTLEDNYFSTVTMSHSKLFFNEQGEPTDIEGNQIVGFYIQAYDGKAKPIKVFVRPFTGKVTFIDL